MKRTAYDMKGPKSTTAIVLLKGGKLAGRIVANWSDNPMGTVCTATLNLYVPIYTPMDDYTHGTGRAGGYGYDKLSSAIYAAYKEATGKYPEGFSGGDGRHRALFESFGFEFIQVL